MSNSAPNQPSLLEYARFHGLAENYLCQDAYADIPLKLLSGPEDVRLPDFTVPSFGGLPPESKFRLDSGAVSLSASCLKPPPSPNRLDTLGDHHRVKELKLEQPALKTDHENDMRKVHCRKPTMVALKLALIHFEDEVRERCDWLREMRKLSVCWDRELADEKLQTTREVLKMLQDILRPVYNSQMHDTIIADELAYTKRPTTERLSPPLLPDESDHEDYIPSSPTLHMQLLSEASDTDGGIEVIKKEISNQNRISPKNARPAAANEIEQLLRLAEFGPADNELSGFETEEQRPVEKECHPRLLKLEVPDLEPFAPSMPRRVSDAECVSLILEPEYRRTEEAERTEHTFDQVDRPLLNESFEKVAREAAQAVEKKLAGEKSEPADITMRVAVPKLDNFNFESPRVKTPSSEFLHAMVNNHLKHTHQSFDKSTEREMIWAPLPRIDVKSITGETVEPTPLLTQCTLQPAFTIKGEDLLWRPNELRILRIDEDDDEDELEIERSLEDEPTQPSCSISAKGAGVERKATILKRQQHQNSPPEPTSNVFDFGSLNGFMDTRKAHKRPRLDSQATPKEAYTTDSEKTVADVVEIPATPTQSLATNINDLLAPKVPESSPPCNIIVSSRLLKSHCQLMQALETRPSPSLTIIYRDLGGGIHAGDEPDMILSPTTAAIFTTLQAITQRSLPGQGSSRPAIFKRILHLSHLYDRLFVLTTLPPSDATPLESPTTCSQISTLTTFCSSLSLSNSSLSPRSIVQPILIPSAPTLKSPTTLIKPQYLSPLYQWTYALILKHASKTSNSTPPPHSSLTLLPSETTWELFLRRSGLNPYAAQHVLATLKKPAQCGRENGNEASHHLSPEEEIRDVPAWGLAGFVHMSPTERISMFAADLGTRAVDRVNAVLDRVWGVGTADGDGDGDAVMAQQGWRRLGQNKQMHARDASGDIASSGAEPMLLD